MAESFCVWFMKISGHGNNIRKKAVYADALMHMVYEFGQLRIRMVQYDGFRRWLHKLGNRGVGVGNRTIPGIFLDIFRRQKVSESTIKSSEGASLSLLSMITPS